jgi:hypothetical protein
MDGQAKDANAVELYLDVLKKSLTNTLHLIEPDTSQENEMRFVHGFIEHYIKGPAVSMLPLARFNNLQSCIAEVLAAEIPGDLIEAGVWRAVPRSSCAPCSRRALLALLPQGGRRFSAPAKCFFWRRPRR